jgi:hypothetical protein
MRLLMLEETLEVLACPRCDQARLGPGDDGAQVVCAGCGTRFPCRQGVVDLVLEDRLSPGARRELAGNTIDITSEPAVTTAVRKDELNWLEAAQTRRAMTAVRRLLEPYGPEWSIVSIGSGAGYELKFLLASRTFQRVYSSDLTWTSTSLAPEALSEFPGELGVFASDFERCPVVRRPGQVGLVYHALHHSDDAHASLEALLDRSFDQLVIVEPVTNWLVEILARFGLAKRVEYSGVSPDWMRLRRIRRIASDRGYSVRVVTWWELPVARVPGVIARRPALWSAIVAVVFAVSRVLSVFSFGSMAAVRLARGGEPQSRAGR